MKHETYLPTLQDVRDLASACSRTAPTGIRNRSLVLTLAGSGLRISEALALKPRDYDPDNGLLRVQIGKGGKHRVVPIGMPEAQEALDRWLERRSALGITAHRTIYCTLDGKPIWTSYIRSMLPRLARKAGIQGRIHAHGLRHFHAATLAQAHCPIVHIQNALGHSSLSTTATYLKRIAPQDTFDAVREAFGRVLAE